MIGGTDVVIKTTPDQVNFFHIGLILKAMERRDPEDISLIQYLTTNSLTKPLKIVQAFMGDQIGIRGTMGNPAIISPYIRDFEKVLKGTLLMRTFQSEFIFRPPLNDKATRIEAFSRYVMRFVDYPIE